jgi:histidinol-phosphate aminotransferase
MNFLSKLACSIEPYTAGEQLNDRKYVKLNTNENPYPPSPNAIEALKNFDGDALRLYPAPNADRLREAIAQTEGLKTENIFCGNGSDEVLALSFPAFFDKDGKGACFADITYSFYAVFADFFSIPKKIVPLTADYRYDFNALSAVDCQGYFITNPNAPTGIAVAKEEILRFVAQNPSKLVIVDEAYIDFCGQSVVDRVKDYPNLLVVKTFSKSYSLAGIRCGYAAGCQPLIDALFRMKDCFNSYPLDRVCQEVCTAAILSGEYYANATRKVVSERARLTRELRNLGFFVPDSGSNFLFAGNKNTGGEYIYKELKARGVLVRYWNKPRLSDFCRITVGSREQNDALLSALREILK